MKWRTNTILFTLFLTNIVDQPALEVELEQGILSGKISADGSFFEYMGIPYGSFNNDTKFKAPLPPPKWKGVYKAVDEFHACPQIFLGVYQGSEDCLKLNLYVPIKAQNRLPVMVYIHGGGFKFGEGGKFTYGPEFIVRNDVILVTIHYRLHALGFLCLQIEEAPGNTGLKDQLAALRWVKKNIAAFGGDPDNITIFGESAGALSTSLLLLSNTTDGLFHKAIVQSGSSLASWAINRKPVSTASIVTKSLGYNTEDPHKIYAILNRLSYKELIQLEGKRPTDIFRDTELIFVPCIEKPLPGVEPFLTDLPYNIISKKTKNIPIMHGTTSLEGYFLTSDDTDEILAELNKKYIFASDLEFKSDEEGMNLTNKIKEFYFGKENISRSNILKLSKLYSELYFEVPSALESEKVMSLSDAPVYNYYFNYSGYRNAMKYLSGANEENGACHSDEIYYLFNSNFLKLFRLNKNDAKFIDLFTRMWTNFAKYGNPTPPSDNQLPVKWIPSSKNDLKYMYIDQVLKMGPIPNPKPYELWKNVYATYRRMDLKYFYD